MKLIQNNKVSLKVKKLNNNIKMKSLLKYIKMGNLIFLL